jgi:accessory colonization factor AcfC
LAATLSVICIGAAASAETLRVYGPGGPAPAMKEIAAAFLAGTGHEVIVTAGPAPRWIEQARADADLIFSGSEQMMTGFVAAHGAIVEDSIVPLYLRPSAILVRKGNPEGVSGVASLLEPGIDIMVVDGAGQVGMWEDVAGRLGEVAALRAFRDNIAVFAPNSGAAREIWTTNQDLDAWLIWNHWQIDNPDIADMVSTEPELTIYRSTSIGLTTVGAAKPAAAAFVDYLQSDAAAAIFDAHGWRRSF